MSTTTLNDYREYAFTHITPDRLLESLRALKYENIESISTLYRWIILRVSRYNQNSYVNEFLQPPYETRKTVILWEDDVDERLMQYQRYPRQHTIEISNCDKGDDTIQIQTDGDTAFRDEVLHYYRALCHTVHSSNSSTNNGLTYLIRCADQRVYIRYKTPLLKEEMMRLLQWDLARLCNLQANNSAWRRDMCVVREYRHIHIEYFRNMFYKNHIWLGLPTDDISGPDISRVVTHLLKILAYGPAFINAINNYITRRFLHIGSAHYALVYVYCIHLRSVHSTTLEANINMQDRENIRLTFSREILLLCLKQYSNVHDPTKRDHVRDEIYTLLRKYVSPSNPLTTPGSFTVLQIFLHNKPCVHLADIKTYVYDYFNSTPDNKNVIAYICHIPRNDSCIWYMRNIERACNQLIRPESNNFVFAEGLYMDSVLKSNIRLSMQNMLNILFPCQTFRDSSGFEITERLYKIFLNPHSDLFANTKSFGIHMNDQRILEETNGFSKEGNEGVLICNICMVNATCVAYFPCGHMGVCVACARSIPLKSGTCDEYYRICPMCKQRIWYTVILNEHYINTYEDCPGCINVEGRTQPCPKKEHYYVDMVTKKIVHCNLCFNVNEPKTSKYKYLKVYI